MNLNNNNLKNNNNIIISRTNGSQACAACKYQRRKCASDCILAPYFPHDRQRQFLNAHKLFGVSNITKIIRHLSPPEKDEAMRTIIFESDVRAVDPVGGCYRIIRQLQRQIEQSQAELDLVLHHLAYCRAAAAAAANSGDSVSLPNNNRDGHDDVIAVNNNNNFGPLREEWYEQQQQQTPNVNVYPYHYHHHLQPQYFVVQNNGDQQLAYHCHVADQTNNNVAWEMHAARDTTPPPSSVVPPSQLSQDNDGCDSMKPILDLSGYVEDLNFGPEETLEESDEVNIVKEQDKAALNEEEESLSNMLKIMI